LLLESEITDRYFADTDLIIDHSLGSRTSHPAEVIELNLGNVNMMDRDGVPYEKGTGMNWETTKRELAQRAQNVSCNTTWEGRVRIQTIVLNQ
jgi:hypothetical protein